MDNQQINKIKLIINHDIKNSLLILILFDMFRYFDKGFIEDLNLYQNDQHIKFNQNQRFQLRKYYYYGEQKYLDYLGIAKFPRVHYSNSDVIEVTNDFLKRIENDAGRDKIQGQAGKDPAVLGFQNAGPHQSGGGKENQKQFGDFFNQRNGDHGRAPVLWFCSYYTTFLFSVQIKRSRRRNPVQAPPPGLCRRMTAGISRLRITG